MDDKDYDTTYAIPANYTDSGKLFGGMLETRNTIEAVLLLLAVGYPEMLLPIDLTIKIIIMTVTLFPIGIVALMGVGGDSLGQYLLHVLRFWGRKRKLSFRRVECVETETKKSRRPGKQKKTR